jgi:small subunit ribosomal protein S20
MAKTPSAAKRARQTERRTLINRRIDSEVKSSLKGVRAALKSGNKSEAQESARRFVSILDKAVKTGNVHKNAAARHKSAMGKALASLS